MKKALFVIIPVCIVAVIVIALLFINKGSSTLSEEKRLTAEDVVLKLKEKNTNVGRYVVYNEETDINSLLGRPNQYTSKATFEDTRLEQSNKNLDPEHFSKEEINEPTGGTVEVFNNKEDMQKRKDYVSAVTSSVSAFAEYSYSNNYILLRLNHDLTPNQVQEYENIFKDIFEQ